MRRKALPTSASAGDSQKPELHPCWPAPSGRRGNTWFLRSRKNHNRNASGNPCRIGRKSTRTIPDAGHPEGYARWVTTRIVGGRLPSRVALMTLVGSPLIGPPPNARAGIAPTLAPREADAQGA